MLGTTNSSERLRHRGEKQREEAWLQNHSKQYEGLHQVHPDQIYVLGTREVERTALRDSKSKDRKAGKIL